MNPCRYHHKHVQELGDIDPINLADLNPFNAWEPVFSEVFLDFCFGWTHSKRCPVNLHRHIFDGWPESEDEFLSVLQESD